MAKSVRSTITAAVVLCAFGLSGPAAAAGFTPEGHQHWLEVAKGLIAATSAETQNMMAPCPGFGLGGSGEIRHEFFQVPRWAVNAHAQTCYAFKIISTGGKGFMHTNAGDACKVLKKAVGELDNAKVGVDPDDVVAAAGQLRSALVSLASDFKDAKACRFG